MPQAVYGFRAIPSSYPNRRNPAQRAPLFCRFFAIYRHFGPPCEVMEPLPLHSSRLPAVKSPIGTGKRICRLSAFPCFQGLCAAHAVRDSLASAFPLRETGKDDKGVDQCLHWSMKATRVAFDYDSNPLHMQKSRRPFGLAGFLTVQEGINLQFTLILSRSTRI